MDLYLAFLTGVLGSMHCVGMCGAIVMAYSAQQPVTIGDGTVALKSSLWSGLPGHMVYNGGRVASYTIIGALAGLMGGLIVSIQTIGIWFSVIAGAILVIAGLFMLGVFPRFDIWTGGEESWSRKLHIRSVTNLLTLGTLESKFYIGLLTPFLPCGLLYSMFLKAASTGSAFDGGLTMLVFGAGIVPSLVLTGLVSTYAGIKLRYYANKLAAVTIILMGTVMILRGAGVTLPFMGNLHDDHLHSERQIQNAQHDTQVGAETLNQ